MREERRGEIQEAAKYHTIPYHPSRRKLTHTHTHKKGYSTCMFVVLHVGYFL